MRVRAGIFLKPRFSLGFYKTLQFFETPPDLHNPPVNSLVGCQQIQQLCGADDNPRVRSDTEGGK